MDVARRHRIRPHPFTVRRQREGVSVGTRKVNYEGLRAAVESRGYILGERGGRGASATVFHATRIGGNGRDLAIKVLAGRDAEPCWRRECAALTKLARSKKPCPYVPNILDSFALEQTEDTEGGSLYALVTPFYGSGTLRGLLNKNDGRLDAATCDELFDHISDAVCAAHSMGIAHCDIKLDNILLDRRESDGQLHAVLCDWGLCELERPRECRVVRGTLMYAAPELAVYMIERQLVMKLPEEQRAAANRERLGKQRPYDAMACDAWALGLCLWIMTVGRHPFDSDSSEETYELIQKSTAAMSEHERRTRACVPEDRWEIITMLMQARPEHRWQVQLSTSK
jgi:serine/threonine protein kinase